MSDILAVIAYPNIDPEIFRIGPVAIRWYAIAYIAGLLLGWWYVVRLLRTKKLWAGPPFNNRPPMTVDDIGDLFVWIAVGVIVGGRLGYVLFYGVFFCGIWGAPACGDLPGGFLSDPIRIIAAWEGGMSFHGGVLGVLIAVWLFVRRRKLNLLAVGDLICAAVPIGLFFGRIANFVNAELWGKVSDLPWAMVFCNDTIRRLHGGACPAGDQPRHPSQLYEAFLEGAVLFVILRVLMTRFQLHRRPGLIAASFMAGYGVFRFLVEFWRDSESVIVAWFSMGQLLSLPMWAGAAFLFWWSLTKPVTYTPPPVPVTKAAVKKRK
jgi:phosphatidylglycerol:prolipoprotein diacylglycerol transferase